MSRIPGNAILSQIPGPYQHVSLFLKPYFPRGLVEATTYISQRPVTTLTF